MSGGELEDLPIEFQSVFANGIRLVFDFHVEVAQAKLAFGHLDDADDRLRFQAMIEIVRSP